MKYKEAPMLADLVKQGKLPPVEQRLPEEPYVVKPTNEVGKYGGMIRSFMLNATDTPAPQNATLNYNLLGVPRDVKSFIAKQPMYGWEPVLARDYKWNTDATELTIYLRRGLKWSDGAPCTAEDWTWAWNDIRFNKEFQPNPDPWALVGGKPITLSAPDPYTLVFKFPAPNPSFIYQLRINNTCNTPKHYLSKFHPKYTQGKTYKDLQEKYSNWLDPEKPFLSAWRVQSNEAGKGVTCERNPYFCGVDTEGNQLPYADSYAFPYIGNQENAVLKAIAGEIDVAERNMQLIEKVPLLKQNEERGKYKTLLWYGTAFTQANFITFNYACKDEAQPELRDLLRSPDFRLALSLAINRADMNQTLYLGMGRPTTYAVNSSSPYWDKEMEEIVQQNVKQDLRKADELLTKLGLVDRNGDKIREYPNGKPVSIIFDVASEYTIHMRAGEMIVRDWRQIGIDAKLNTISRSLLYQRRDNRTFHVHPWGSDANDIPLLRPSNEIFAIFNIQQDYYKNIGEPPPDGMEKLFEVQNRIFATADPQESLKLHKEMAKIRVSHVLDPHLVADVPIVVIRSNRMGNVPDVGYSLQTYIYEKPEQFYIKG